MANSAYDIYLGDVSSLQGYRLRSLLRDSAPLIASRFSTGQQGQTDLDLLKSSSVDSLAGGMFQRLHVDPTKVARAVGVFNKYDENFYPTIPSSAALTGGLNTGYYPILKAESEIYTFVMGGSFGAGTWYNALRRVNKSDSTFTSITLPAALASNAVGYATGMCLHKNYLFVLTQTATGAGVAHYRYDLDAGTWQDLGVGSGVIVASMRGILYGINYQSTIYNITSETATTAVTTALDTVGSANSTSQPVDMKEFNGALWIAKPDGLYRFDGIKAVKVLPLVTSYLHIFNGAMYFVAGGWLYRFDGGNVQKVQFFGTLETVAPLGITSNSDYLFVQTNSLTSAYSSGDKAQAASGLRRIYAYDGASWQMINETGVSLGSSYITALVYVGTHLYDMWANYLVASWDNLYYRYDLANLFSSAAVTTSSTIDITTSEFDAGFPNVYKALEVIEPLYNGLIVGDVITTKYQYYDGKVWSAWIAAPNISSTTSNVLEITDATKKLFKRIKINVVLTPAAASTATLKGVAWRYTLQPRNRWRWQVNIIAAGTPVIQDRNGTAPTTQANALANAVTKSVKQKTPLFMLTPDYGIVKAGISAAALTFIVKGQPAIYTDPYSEYPLCAVLNSSGVWEVLRVSAVSYVGGATNETTITVLERAYYGVTPATINANAEFHLAFKVYITRLLRDQPILDDATYNEQTSGESQLQREFLIELTEV